MNESRAALRYAKATLNLAVEQKATDAIDRDMRSIVQTISDSNELKEMLASPILEGSSKKEVLLTLFKNFNEITKEVFSLLVSKKRIDLLYEVASKYIALNDDLKGENVALVTTAVPLTPSLEKKILSQIGKITKNKITLENQIDESIIGGFILRIGDLQYNASISNKLNSLKREFTNSI
ncbi:ATP synthase F1 subunit delta [Eudoraea adriatica]|uniref:ATP synthase F1 subunit delta n=1 Tax=Eudoraea adriatica TaxID=446681 RepID=UPI00037B1E2A|nr:ATP synthase F1 subunit delta [Eudoraea adriatica]